MEVNLFNFIFSFLVKSDITEAEWQTRQQIERQMILVFLLFWVFSCESLVTGCPTVMEIVWGHWAAPLYPSVMDWLGLSLTFLTLQDKRGRLWFRSDLLFLFHTIQGVNWSHLLAFRTCSSLWNTRLQRGRTVGVNSLSWTVCFLCRALIMHQANWNVGLEKYCR